MKILGIKAYGSIPHLPGSRTGPADHFVNKGQERICTEKKRNGDRIIVQEKLDGSCVAVALIKNEIVPLTRSGYLATSSPFEQHHIWDKWVHINSDKFRQVLNESERICGEWLALAHGTKYDLTNKEPFVAFDIIKNERIIYDEFYKRVNGVFAVPKVIEHENPVSVQEALLRLGKFGFYGAIDEVEGVVYRVERNNRVEFLTKYVKHNKIDGKYLSEIHGNEPIWNWKL